MLEHNQFNLKPGVYTIKVDSGFLDVRVENVVTHNFNPDYELAIPQVIFCPLDSTYSEDKKLIIKNWTMPIREFKELIHDKI